MNTMTKHSTRIVNGVVMTQPDSVWAAADLRNKIFLGDPKPVVEAPVAHTPSVPAAELHAQAPAASNTTQNLPQTGAVPAPTPAPASTPMTHHTVPEAQAEVLAGIKAEIAEFKAKEEAEEKRLEVLESHEAKTEKETPPPAVVAPSTVVPPVVLAKAKK